MYSYSDLWRALEASEIKRSGTLLIHSSMKSIGEVNGGADTVLKVFMDYLEDGLLLFPTHTWEDWNLVGGIYDPRFEKSCVGLLPNLFMKKKGVFRSLHPTHSVAAYGKRAQEYIKRDEESFTPCPAKGCFGGLYEEDAQILFLGVPLTKNTYIHSLEEQLNVKNRINPKERRIKIVQPNSSLKEIEFHGHFSTLGDVSKNYGKILQPMLSFGYAKSFSFGQAECYLVEVRPMTKWVLAKLEENPDLFCDNIEII